MKQPPLPLRFGGGPYPGRPAPPPFAYRPDRLRASLQTLPGVGRGTAARLEQFGLHTVGDLLAHFPRRYDDYRDRRLLSEVKIGEEATVRVVVERAALAPTRKRGLQIVRATVRDGSGAVEAVWFNQPWLADSLQPGVTLSLRGTLRVRSRRAALVVKTHEILGREGETIHTEGVVPVYAASESVSVKQLRALVHQVVQEARRLPDPLPPRLRIQERLPSRADAVVALHEPATPEEGQQARSRMVFEELYLLQLGLLLHKEQAEEEGRAAALSPGGDLTARFLESLPFVLTEGQRDAMGSVDAGLDREQPMRLLLQGDVGSGKTVLALYALLRAVERGHQGALLVPTETLAVQHMATVEDRIGSLARCELITASVGQAGRRDLLRRLEAGDIDLVVGTHALLQQDVCFRSLAVVIVDEQHRFGVVQRDELVRRAAECGLTPHMLAMTATPIPRTLALTLYGDLDLAVIPSLPEGRKRITTRVVPEGKRADAYAFTRKQLDAGRQAYIVCPTIEESESLSAAAATAEAERLRRGELAGYRVEVLHGQLKTGDRKAIMKAFTRNEVQVLVATSVIEVGIDVPNATVIIIEGAERFGLAQLHQLRGRVGRGRVRSFCLLFADPTTDQARDRLRAISRTSDGFELADRDLEIRGEGQIIGARQSGASDLRLARLVRDRALLERARAAAQETLKNDPGLRAPRDAPLSNAVGRGFSARIDNLFRI